MKHAHTIAKQEAVIGHLLNEDGRIKFTGYQRSLLHQSGLLTGSGWLDWDDSRLVSRKYEGIVISPLGTAIRWLKDQVDRTHKPWLWLYGKQYGIGKTLAAQILGVHWIAATSKPVLFVSWGAYLETKKDSWSNDDATVTTDLSQMVEAPFLIMDDLCGGPSFSSTWALGQLFVVLDQRAHKTTVFTSNYSINEFRESLRGGKAKDRITHTDVLGKVSSRLGRGPGGSFATEIKFESKAGDMRQKETASA